MKKQKSKLDVILEVTQKASKDFIKGDREELLNYLNTNGVKALKKRLENDIKEGSGYED
jgi:hypothetical protein